MDFEDGKRCPWLVAAVGGSRGGLRWGSVYRLKMAVWALFCGPSSRLPARPPRAQCRESASLGTRAPRSRPPGARCLRGPGSSVPASGVGGRTRPERDGLRTRAPNSPRPRCMKTTPTPPTSRSRAKGRVGPPPPRLAFAPPGSDPDHPFSKSSTSGTIFRGLFTVI